MFFRVAICWNPFSDLSGGGGLGHSLRKAGTVELSILESSHRLIANVA